MQRRWIGTGTATLTSELIGQALVYKTFVAHAGAQVLSTVISAERARPAFKAAAEELGLQVVPPDDGNANPLLESGD